MPGTNDFKPFSVGVYANVIDQATYAALTSLLENGFVAGVADSAKVNKVLRQATFGAAALGEIISLHGSDANDDGDLATFVTNLMDAISALSSVVDASTSVKGKIQLATGAEAQALSSTTKAICPATLASAFQGANQSTGATGFQIIPGGTIIQRGTVTVSEEGGGTQEVNVTFPMAFVSNVQLCAQFLYSGSKVNNSNVAQIRYKSLTGFTVDNQWFGNGSNLAGTIDWIAYGN